MKNARKYSGYITRGLALIVLMMNLPSLYPVAAQTTYTYPLNGSYNEATASAPALIPRTNALGQTGTFVTLPLPATSCGGNGVFSGYTYNTNAGLSFDIPTGFITCEYTIQFTWHYDNPVIPGSVPPQAAHEWIRVFSFGYADDSGIELWTVPPSLNGTLYYWHLTPFLPGFPLCFPDFGQLSPADYFNPTDFYQMTFTRTCDGQFNVYTNGALIGGFIDDDDRYVASGANPQITFFRDTASTACYPTAFPDEASSGFIADLVISNDAFTAAAVSTDFTTWCPILLPVAWQLAEGLARPEGNLLRWKIDAPEWVDVFVVSRSSAAGEWEQVGTVPIAGEAGDQLFSFVDRFPEKQLQYYRIGARDLDGQVQYSPVIELLSASSVRIYPNPAQYYLMVELPADEAFYPLEIFDARGLRLQNHRLLPGTHRLSLGELPKGLLLIRIGGAHPQTWRIRKE